MDYEEYKRKALEPIINYIESVMASYSKEELEARIKKALPEKESEDERARKYIITRVMEENMSHYLRDMIIAYLEKHKPHEPTEEDKYGQKMLCIAYKLMYEHIPENLRTQEFWDSLKFMREYTGKAAIVQFERPAEWSEEDKETIEKAICVLGANFEPYEEFSGLDITRCQLVERLKSLRPRPHWKPSDEQMEWLESAVRLSTDKPRIHGIIISLYEQLKRL